MPNDAQGVDPQALLDHMVQERKIPLTGADDRAQLQRIADEAVAREQPDFSADDQQITDAVAATFGSLNTQQKADTVRCVAEFAERMYAQKHGTIPPDEADGQPGFGGGGDEPAARLSSSRPRGSGRSGGTRPGHSVRKRWVSCLCCTYGDGQEGRG